MEPKVDPVWKGISRRKKNEFIGTTVDVGGVCMC